MKRGWWLRFSFLLFLVVLSVMAVIPTIFKFTDDTKFPVKSKIALGLDLQGGLYMILGIDFKKVYKDEVVGYARKIETLLKDQEIIFEVGELNVSEAEDPKQTIKFLKASDESIGKQKIKEYFPGILRITKEENGIIEFALNTAVRKQIEDQSVSKSIEVIRNRIDEFGVSEPEITSQGKDRIVVQLPGVKDIERAKDLIGKTAKLEFKIVNDEVLPTQVDEWLKKSEAAGITYKKGERFSLYVEKLNAFLANDLPKGYVIAFQKVTSNKANVNVEDEKRLPYIVDQFPRITGDDLQDASVQIDNQKNEPYVSMNFKSAGAKRFEVVTGDNIGKRLAVILDGNVYTAPTVQAKIGGGHAQITLGAGNFNKTMQQARDIALVLRAGALPVQLDFLEQRIVGPSLGEDSIKKANWASIAGCLVVFIFILIYYKLSGFIAIGTLILNVLFVVATLVAFDATLTLPGIAGIALTVGMAVDGNIIIYERIREEMRKGVSHFKAVEEGFGSALWTILDANITTALAGACLLYFGTGPIRGFAVTLLIGIAATVYTSYYVSNIVFEFYMEKVEGTDLSI